MKQPTYKLAFKFILTLALLANALANEQAAGQAAPSDHASLESAASPSLHDSALLADDLIASESSQSQSPASIQSANDESQMHKAFTSGQALRADPMQQMAASIAPAFVAPPAQHQQQQQANLHQMAGQFVQGLNPHQMAALRQQQAHQQKAFNPFIAAALSQQQQQQNFAAQQQPQMAASFQQARIMNGAQSQMGVMQQQHHGHIPGQQQQQLHQQQQQYNQMASHHQHPQMQHQAMIQQQHQPQHVMQHQQMHPQQQQQQQSLFGQQGPISMAESSVRQNIVPAPAVAPSAAAPSMGDSIAESSVGAASEPVHDVVVPAASSTSTAVIQATSGIPAPTGGPIGSSSPVGGTSSGAQATSWPLQAPDVPKITNLEVKCEKNLMKVSIEFDKMFNGVIFSKGHYSQGQCVHVGQNSGKQQAYFDISINSCGTQGNTQNGLYGMGGNTGSGTYFENTIVIQYDPNVQEVYDHARKLRCTWHDQYEKAVTFRPFPVDMLDIVRADFAGDNVGCWMQIQVGKGPWASEVAGIVKIGQTMTMVLAIKDEENKFDMLVRNCFAHDGKRGPIELVDKTGCITRPKLMSRFTKIKNFGSSATVLSYAHFQAFKFPDSMEVHFQCTIQICRHQCPDQCSANSQASDNTYTESTIHGTMNIHGRSGEHSDSSSSGSLRKFGSAGSLTRERRDLGSHFLRRSHRHANESLGHEGEQQLNKMIGVNRVIQVVSSGDLAFSIQQQQSSATLNGSLQSQSQSQQAAPSDLNGEQLALESRIDPLTSSQICMSSYNFVLSLVVLCLLLLSSCLIAISLYWRQQFTTTGSQQHHANQKLLSLSSPSPSILTSSSHRDDQHQNQYTIKQTKTLQRNHQQQVPCHQQQLHQAGFVFNQ